MFLDPSQLPFSAKSNSRSLPPVKKTSERDREYLRPKEVEAMIGTAKKVGRHGIRDAAVILLMFRHGLRTAELVALKWSQVDLTEGYIEIHRVKHGHDSIHPLRAPELKALRQIQREYPETQYVFVSERKAPLSTRTIRHNDLTKLPHRSTRNHLNDLIAHLIWLEAIGEIAPLLKGLTQSKIKHFTSEAKALTASEMKDINLPKRLTLILCLIYSAQVKTRDNLVEMFLKQMKKISIRATEELQSIKEKQQATTEKLVSVLTNILQIFNVEADNSNSLEQLQEIFTQTGGVEHLLTECEEINADQGNNHLPLMWRFYKSHRSTFYRIFNALKIESTSSDRKLVEAVEILRSNFHRRGEWIKDEVDLSFASQQWQKMVLIKDKNGTKLMRRHFEVCNKFYPTFWPIEWLRSKIRTGSRTLLINDFYLWM